MKTALIVLMMTFGNFLMAQQTKTATVTIHVENITSDQGKLMLGMYTEKTFMKAKPDFSEKKEIVDGKVTITFENVPAGTYAISALHDSNDNGRMDFQSTGMPAEDYALSNNPMLMGPPTWADAKFEVTEGENEMTIRF